MFVDQTIRSKMEESDINQEKTTSAEDTTVTVSEETVITATEQTVITASDETVITASEQTVLTASNNNPGGKEIPYNMYSGQILTI